MCGQAHRSLNCHEFLKLGEMLILVELPDDNISVWRPKCLQTTREEIWINTNDDNKCCNYDVDLGQVRMKKM